MPAAQDEKQIIVKGARATRIVLELNSVPRFAVSEPFVEEELVGRFGKLEALGNETTCRFEQSLTNYQIEPGDEPTLCLLGRVVDPALDQWLDQTSPHEKLWYAYQRRSEEPIAQFCSRIFGTKLDAVPDPSYADLLVTAHSVILRPGDASNLEMLQAFVGWLRQRWARLTGWVLNATEKTPARLIVAPRSPDKATGFPESRWKLSPATAADARGPFWHAQDVRRYVRTDWDDAPPDLRNVIAGRQDCRANVDDVPLPGFFRIQQRLFLCVRTEILLKEYEGGTPLSVSAYLAPWASVGFVYPTLCDVEFRGPVKFAGWSDTGDRLKLELNSSDSWALGGDGVDMDTGGHLLAEYFTAAPPHGDFAGLYVTPHQESTLVVRLANGAGPRVDGGPQKKHATLEAVDLAINVSTLALSATPSEKNLDSANRIQLSSELVLNTQSTIAVTAQTVTLAGKDSEIEISRDTVVDGDMYVTGKVEMG
jgi:hypothetical protein